MKPGTAKAGLLICSAMLLGACSGGGGSEVGNGGGTNSGPQGTVLTGTVMAPNGQLAKAKLGLFQWVASLFVSESHAQGVPGLQPVGGAQIFVFQVDNNGNPVASPSNPNSILAQTTTGADGSFSVKLPTSTPLGSNVIVQATTAAAPARVCDPSMPGCPQGQTNLNHPAVATNLSINPSSELATRQIFLRIAQAGATGNLNNYTNAEVSAFISLVQTTVAAEPTLIAGNLNDTFNNIANRVQILINDVFPGIETPGQADPTTVGGTYNIMIFHTNLGWLTGAKQQDGTLERAVEFGTLLLNANGTFNLAGQIQGAQLTESCSSSCTRGFSRSAINQTDLDSGTYVRTSNKRIIFKSQDGTTTIAFMNPSETIAILPLDDSTGFALAIKQGSGLSNATLTQGTGVFNYADFGSHLSSTQASQSVFTGNPPTLGGTWPGPLLSEIVSGTLTFANNNVTVLNNGFTMGQQLTCTPTASGCNLTAALTRNSFSDNFATPFSVAPTGTLTLSNVPGQGPVIGNVSSDGDYAFLAHPETDGGSIVIAARQSGVAPLDGTYKLIVFGDTFHTNGEIDTFLEIGLWTFEPPGGCDVITGCHVTIQTGGREVGRGEVCPGPAPLPFCGFAVGGATSSFGITSPYHAFANGTLTINDPNAGTISGFVSPDATLIVATNSVDNFTVGGTGPFSRRFIAIGVRQ